ncbi:MAG: H-X9-DG-CTERM domain-containing protein [Fimbriimonadales bacterium]
MSALRLNIVSSLSLALILVFPMLLVFGCGRPAATENSIEPFVGVWKIETLGPVTIEITADGKFKSLGDRGRQRVEGDVVVSEKHLVLVPNSNTTGDYPGFAVAFNITTKDGKKQFSLAAGSGQQTSVARQLSEEEAKKARDGAATNEATGEAVPTEKQDCLSNLRQLSTAMQLYMSDNDDTLMQPSQSWTTVLQPYLRNRSVLSCPTLPDDKDAYGYALIQSLLGMSATKIESPATTPLAIDSSNTSKDAMGGLELLPKPGRHEGGNNVAYADAHVKWIKEGNKP